MLGGLGPAAGRTARTYEVGAGDCILHLAEEEAHTLVAGDDGLDVLAFGAAARTPRSPSSRAPGRVAGPALASAATGRNPFEREAAAGPLELPEPRRERPPTIVATRRRARPGATSAALRAITERDLGHAAGSGTRASGTQRSRRARAASRTTATRAEEEMFVVLDGDGQAAARRRAPPCARGPRRRAAAGHAASRTRSRPATTGLSSSPTAPASPTTSATTRTRARSPSAGSGSSPASSRSTTGTAEDLSLLDKELVFVTGKGGVGQVDGGRRARASPPRARPAHDRRRGRAPRRRPARARRRRVRRVRRARGRRGPAPLSIDPSARWRSTSSTSCRSAPSPTRSPRSRIFTYLAAATPGMRELLTVGKVVGARAARTPHAGAHPYDLVVVDAPGDRPRPGGARRRRARSPTLRASARSPARGRRSTRRSPTPATAAIVAVTLPRRCRSTRRSRCAPPCRTSWGWPSAGRGQRAAPDRFSDAEAAALRAAPRSPGVGARARRCTPARAPSARRSRGCAAGLPRAARRAALRLRARLAALARAAGRALGERAVSVADAWRASASASAPARAASARPRPRRRRSGARRAWEARGSRDDRPRAAARRRARARRARQRATPREPERASHGHGIESRRAVGDDARPEAHVRRAHRAPRAGRADARRGPLQPHLPAAVRRRGGLAGVHRHREALRPAPLRAVRRHRARHASLAQRAGLPRRARPAEPASSKAARCGPSWRRRASPPTSWVAGTGVVFGLLQPPHRRRPARGPRRVLPRARRACRRLQRARAGVKALLADPARRS